MNVRIVAAGLVAAAVAVGASTAGAKTAAPTGTTARTASSITVWLQNDAQSGWPQIVAAANSTFKAQHPGVDVKIEYQGWGDHLTKFDAALAGGDAPDVIELGNTETTKYMAAGALRQLTAAGYPNAKTWLPGLKASCTYGGRTFCVPYYAGARAVIYRTDLYRKAGIKGTPKSLAEFVADGQKLMAKFGKDRYFSSVYFPGKYWYAAMSFVYDFGGAIAVQKGGKWQGALNSAQAVKALTVWKSITQSLSRANRTGDEGNPQQALVFAKGHVASFIGNGWEWPYALDAKVGNPNLAPAMGAYPMPSHVKGRLMPTFLGGSDLGIPITSKNVSLAADWLKIFTGTSSMRQLATDGKVIPNTTTLTGINASNPQLAPFARAAASSWFVPTAPNWANVESANVLQDMLVRIVTNRGSVASAASSASNQITSILNAKS